MSVVGIFSVFAAFVLGFKWRFPLLGMMACIGLWISLGRLPKWQVERVEDLTSKDRFALENEARQTMSQIVGGIVLLAGVYFGWRNVNDEVEKLNIASEGQITDRFTKATEQLGNSKVAVRLGGIYALERISVDSLRDHGPIMEVLTAYVRENAQWQPTGHSSNAAPTKDIQAIITVLGRRNIRKEDPALDLSYTDLRRVRFSETTGEGAHFNGTNFVGARCDGANFRGADLRDADFSEGSVRGADLQGASLAGASLTNTDVREANFTDTIGLTQAQVNEAKGNARTVLPEGLRIPDNWLAK